MLYKMICEPTDFIRYEPADIIIHIQGKGVVVKEKSLIAFRKSDNKIVAIGTEVETAVWKESENVVVVSPFRQGVIGDYTLAEKMLSYLLKRTLGKWRLSKPAIAVCVPKGTTSVEKKAMMDALFQAGAKDLFITEIPVEQFIREFPDKYPDKYKKFKITVGITKDEPERYIEERLKDIMIYAGEENISRERVCELLQKVKEQY